MSQDRVAHDIRILTFAAYRDASREGEKGRERGRGRNEKKSAYHMTSNMSRRWE